MLFFEEQKTVKMNNKDIIENIITTVHFLAADHKIQDSALRQKKTKPTNHKQTTKKIHCHKQTKNPVVWKCPDSSEPCK